MKKLTFLVMIIIVAVFTSSCAKDEIEIQEIDYTISENLVGTNWVNTTYFTEPPTEDSIKDEKILIFISISSVEGWRKIGDEEMENDWNGQFSISNDTISILSNFQVNSFSGPINGETMELTNLNTGTEYIFRKQ